MQNKTTESVVRARVCACACMCVCVVDTQEMTAYRARNAVSLLPLALDAAAQPAKWCGDDDDDDDDGDDDGDEVVEEDFAGTWSISAVDTEGHVDQT